MERASWLFPDGVDRERMLEMDHISYRAGGEEFLVLLPGADLERATEIAEALRHAVADVPQGGHQVTMSFGAAASRPEEPFDYRDAFAAADAALYEASTAGATASARPRPAAQRSLHDP
jgi:two-component system, cell cycle response regulator